jgi:hypothetical protein
MYHATLVTAAAALLLGCSVGEVGGHRFVEAGVDGTVSFVDGTLVDGKAKANEAGLPCALTCTGCCLEDLCLPGTTDKACGKGGKDCRDCSLNGQTCESQTCQGVCTPSCASKCQGEDDGCGNPCPTNSCGGCCQQSLCRPGTSSSACGVDGTVCVSCASPTPTCSAGTCKCVPSCANKCTGESDGCGGTCTANTCTGCCDAGGKCLAGTSSAACGVGGASCVSCTATGLKCVSGTCQCVPECMGKCKGAPDGCGGACPMNHCTGCCDASLVCQTGQSGTVCGKAGAPCADCTAGSKACQGGSCI